MSGRRDDEEREARSSGTARDLEHRRDVERQAALGSRRGGGAGSADQDRVLARLVLLPCCACIVNLVAARPPWALTFGPLGVVSLTLLRFLLDSIHPLMNP
jgi:hypothetical protein